MDFRETRHCKVISVVVLFFFCWTFVCGPDGAYAMGHGLGIADDHPETPAMEKSNAARFTEALGAIENTLKDHSLKNKEKKERLASLIEVLTALDEGMQAQFAATERHIKDKGLTGEVLQRHKKFVKHYRDNWGQLKKEIGDMLADVPASEFEAMAQKVLEHLQRVNPPKKFAPLDPTKLPHRAAEPTKNKPRLNKSDFTGGLRAQADEPILVASSGSLDGLLDGDMDYMQLALASGAPTEADLAETIDIKFTPAIMNTAESLDHDPLKIYEWVRNNVEFVPTYGSIQGADYCLQTMKCNATDTASLLIALLRASGVPARYAEGTVEMPIDKVMNWAGGFTNATAAIDFMASGGIPTTGLVEGGKLVQVRLEHVWVEAWVDYIPSRGAKSGEGDTWIPLDASFKQFEYTQGMDITSEVPFDAQGLVDQMLSTAIFNETDGSVTGVDSSIVNSAMADYRADVEAYMTAEHPDATVGDVLGTKTIMKQEFPYLLGTLPYRLKVVGARYAELPGSMRHSLRFAVTGGDGIAAFADPLDLTLSLPELAGKKVTLSYSPATQADEEVILSFIPKPHQDGTPIDPSELPASLPAYLINLIPELRVNGAVVATGGAVTMGIAEDFKMTFMDPSRGSDIVANIIEAGEYFGIAVDVSSVSQAQMEGIASRLQDTKAKLDAVDFTGLTADDLLGDLLYATAMTYHAEMDLQEDIQSKTVKVLSFRVPSEAIFKTDITVDTSYGIPVSASAKGFAMDVDRLLSLTKALDGDNAKKIQFLKSSGLNSSALEHVVPEKIFSTPDNQIEAVSAVKALKIASEQGIPIYTITSDNIATVLPQLQLDSVVIDDIRNAVTAGNEVTVAKTDVVDDAWTGCGYIVMNPMTGEGAYMISGDLSGGFVMTFKYQFLMFLTILTYTAAIMAAVALVAAGDVVAIANIGLLLFSFVMYVNTVRNAINRAADGEISVEKAQDIIYTASLAAMATNAVAWAVPAYGGVGSTANEIGLLSMSVLAEMLIDMFAGYIP